MEKWFNVATAAELVGVSPYTINNWYRWWKSKLKKPQGLRLPSYRIGQGGGKFFSEAAIHQLIKFKKELPRGAMAEFNAYYNWGARGTQNLINKGLDKDQVRKKIIKETKHESGKPRDKNHD